MTACKVSSREDLSIRGAEKGWSGVARAKKIVDACPRRGEPRDRTRAVDWNGVPRVIHGGWMRS